MYTFRYQRKLRDIGNVFMGVLNAKNTSKRQ